MKLAIVMVAIVTVIQVVWCTRSTISWIFTEATTGTKAMLVGWMWICYRFIIYLTNIKATHESFTSTTWLHIAAHLAHDNLPTDTSLKLTIVTSDRAIAVGTKLGAVDTMFSSFATGATIVREHILHIFLI